MLIISRRKGQVIRIDDDITIFILEVGRNRTRIGIEAPETVKIHVKREPEMEEEVSE